MRALFNFNSLNLSLSSSDNVSEFYDPEEDYPINPPCGQFNYYLTTLHTYYIPFIIAVGLIGNVLSCTVFLTTHLKMRSSSYYLAALALADLGFLFVVLIVHFSFNEILEIFNTNGWCQFLVYISSVCASLSVWLIVAFTVERFIAVQYPLQRPLICTISRAKTIVITLTICTFTSHSYIFWTAGILPHPGDECEMLPEYNEFMKIVNFVDTLVTLIIPFILIVTMNTMIARNLFLFKRRLQAGSLEEYLDSDKDSNSKSELQHTQSASSSKNVSSHHHHSSHKQQFYKNCNKKSKICTEESNSIHIKTPGRNTISTRTQQNITKMLLLISSVFIALNFPSYVTRLWVYYAFTLQEKIPPETLWCVQQFAMLLYYTNFSINFSLYAMCGVTFRRCLYQMLKNNFKRLTSFLYK